ncbi:p55 [Xanthomonas phage Xop411]|uniref:p55 n=1 Tax=Xanthomonas phage Xop411 TaxID=2913975 RepID=A5H1J5_9CAUD|nr:p55 [Xanthomonas phage Xop411]ABK00199.1 p55 [Xanthomonas phage Xop411]
MKFLITAIRANNMTYSYVVVADDQDQAMAKFEEVEAQKKAAGTGNPEAVSLTVEEF